MRQQARPTGTRRALRLRCAASHVALPPSQLHYFPGRGQAEPCRWVLAATQHSFVDVKLENAEQVRSLFCHPSTAKSQAVTPPTSLAMLALPVFDDATTGIRVVHANAIVRHTARSASILGFDPRETAAVDQVVEACAAFRSVLLRLPFEEEGARASCAAAWRRCAPPLERLLLRAAPSGWIAGGEQHTVADVLVAEVTHSFSELFGDFVRVHMLCCYTHQTVLTQTPSQREGAR